MTSSKTQSPIEIFRSASGAKCSTELGITLPAPPEPFEICVEAVQTGNLLFLACKFRTQGREAKFIVGAELDEHTGSEAAKLVALNAIAVARKHLGLLDKVTRIVRFGMFVATSGHVRKQAKVARCRFGVVARGFRQRPKPLPFCVRSRKPSTLRSNV